MHTINFLQFCDMLDGLRMVSVLMLGEEIE